MNYKSIFNLLGILLGIFSLSFIPPLVLTFVYRESGMEIFLYSFIFFSILGYFSGYFIPLAIPNNGWFVMAAIWGLYGGAHGWKIIYELFFK